MKCDRRLIGLALSGGGIRAAIFHLGVIKWMAENDMLEDVARISTVSGASLCIGLIYSQNHNVWPSSADYMNVVLPKAKKIILTKDIQQAAFRKLILSPHWWNKKVNLIAKMLERNWGISGDISELKKYPLWNINCTTFETGKRFRFSQEKMGDYQTGFVESPRFAISDAIAASAGFPFFIGPYKLRTDAYIWTKSQYAPSNWEPPKGRHIHLWDGGVYDNLGLESVYKLDNGGCLREGLNYLIVSNASDSSGYKKRKSDLSGRNLRRLLDIAMDQVGALRNRNVMDYIKRTKNGMFFKIGNSAETIINASGNDKIDKGELISEYLSLNDAQKVRNYPTTLKRPSESDFDLILKHGYEVAKCTYQCYK